MTNLYTSTIKHNLKRDQETDNPCLKEYNLSLKCLSDNNYIHDDCKIYFENYKNCKHFWRSIVDDRKKKNIIPYLPSPQDRNKIKNEYRK